MCSRVALDEAMPFQHLSHSSGDLLDECSRTGALIGLPPARRVWICAARSSGIASLSKYPVAPASMDCRMCCSSPKTVITIISDSGHVTAHARMTSKGSHPHPQIEGTGWWAKSDAIIPASVYGPTGRFTAAGPRTFLRGFAQTLRTLGQPFHWWARMA
jgi:hypothetical protein